MTAAFGYVFCYSEEENWVKIVYLRICLTKSQFLSQLTQCSARWCGVGSDGREIKWQHTMSHLDEVKYSMLIRKELLDPQFLLTQIPRYQSCITCHLPSLPLMVDLGFLVKVWTR